MILHYLIFIKQQPSMVSDEIGVSFILIFHNQFHCHWKRAQSFHLYYPEQTSLHILDTRQKRGEKVSSASTG